jgi:dTDP-glucose 4,6-dehydratase
LTGKPESLLRYVADRPGHDRRYALDSRKIESELGWKPKISLEEGVRQTIKWYQDNNKWVSDVRAGEYLSYYEKYYDDRDASLKAIADSGSKLPA